MFAEINIFEGARRIALVIKVLSILLAIILAFALSLENARLYLYYVTDSPTGAFQRAASPLSCEIGWRDGTDHEETIYSYDLGGSYSASVQLCFRGQGGLDDASHGNFYESRAKTFQITEEDRAAARSEARSKWYSAILHGFLYAIGSGITIWIILSIAQRIIGWVVRGFLGVPSGQDRRAS